ncbi:MAG: hypothetical protein OXD46_13755 [Chloroflexi bacterium]|nr:hypothetical protein [Chloroflexota bacterium]
MPLPLLVIPLAVAGGSAVVQAVAKLKSHARLNALRVELEELESRHRDKMRQQYERQIGLCRQLDLPEPELPSVLEEPLAVEVAEPEPPLWRRYLKRRNRTLADGSPHSRASIIGRHGASFAAGAIWRVWSAAIMNLLRPITAFLPRLATILPRFAAFGGTGGSIAASTGLRFALGAFNIVGIIVGPLLAGWAIFQEIKNVKRAKSELEETRTERQEELYRYAARTRQLERQLAAATPVADVASS